MDPLYTPEEKQKIYDLSKRGLTYTYAFCENVISAGKLSSYSEDKSVLATQKERANYVPVSLFTDFLGAKVSGKDDDLSIELDGKRFSVYKNKEGLIPVKKGGVVFVPALDSGMVGIMVPVGVIFTLITSRIMYKKGLI